MLAAYILIQVGAETSPDAVDHLRAIPGVKQAHIVLGPTDAIAFLEVPDMEALIECAMAIRAVEWVEATDTRLVVM